MAAAGSTLSLALSSVSIESITTLGGRFYAAGWASQWDQYQCSECPQQVRRFKGCSLKGQEMRQEGAPIMINGETWTSCPGGLFQLAMIKQVSRLSYHCEGRLGRNVSKENPALIEALSAFIMGQRLAQRQQHEAEMRKIRERSHG